MAYRLLYHRAVADDLANVPANMRQRIQRSIVARLATHPEEYGAPLSGTLRGYWKLRVGDYRIVFKVHDDEVHVLAILHRRDVYDAAVKRLR